LKKNNSEKTGGKMREKIICKFCRTWKIESKDETALEKKIACAQLETHVESDHPAEWKNYLTNGGRVRKF
jgi:hypothetical protein